MKVYRKRKNSNVIVSPEALKPGLIVWVGDEGTREERICGENGELLTLEEHRRRREARAAQNRITKPFVRLRPSYTRSERSLLW